MTTLYGIPNCDTIKKARRWLDSNGIEYNFHDFRKDGVDATLLHNWIQSVGRDILLNRKGTTWRKLTEAQKSSLDDARVIQLMLEQPAIIKRPVLELNKKLYVGFTEAEYKEIFS